MSRMSEPNCTLLSRETVLKFASWRMDLYSTMNGYSVSWTREAEDKLPLVEDSAD